MTWRITKLFIIAIGVVAAADRVPRLQVSPNVLISRAHPDLFHGEIWFAADPNNAKRLIGGSMVYDLQKDIMRSAAYVSLDGGQTWESPFLTGESADPACAYSIDGTAYWLHLKRAGDRYMEIFKSKDGGKTWLKPLEAPYLDREYMTVDDTRGKYRGRLYIHAHQAGREDPSTRDIVLFHTDDGGAHFTGIITGPAPEKQFANPGNAAILSDGTFVAVHADLRNGRQKPDPAAVLRQRSGSIAVVSSSDGEHLSEPSKISDWYYPLSENGHLSYIPVIAADRSNGPFRDRLYVVWTDSRSGRAEVYLSWSRDRGHTWSVPKAVNDDAPHVNGASPNDFHGAVAVNKEGIVGVSWYDRRENPDDLGWRQRFAASLDGGVTFSPSVKVSEALYDPSRNDPPAVNEKVERTVLRTSAKFMNPRWAFVNNGGDTGSIVADADGAFHAFWTDNRTGKSQLYTSIVTVDKAGK